MGGTHTCFSAEVALGPPCYTIKEDMEVLVVLISSNLLTEHPVRSNVEPCEVLFKALVGVWLGQCSL